MKHLFCILIILLSLSALAGNNDKAASAVKNVSGKIVDCNGEQVAAAKIIIKETGESYFADLDGNFKFPVKTDKIYSIVVESIGYAPLEVKSSELSLFSDLSLKELE